MDTFSLNTPLEPRERKKLLCLKRLEVYKSVFDKSKHNKKFAIHTPGHWGKTETIKKQGELMEQRS